MRLRDFFEYIRFFLPFYLYLLKTPEIHKSRFLFIPSYLTQTLSNKKSL